jgi:hypothetical protein
MGHLGTQCATCPWSVKNQQKPPAHMPEEWFSKKRRKELWEDLRKGDIMGCHSTIDDNEHNGVPHPEHGTLPCVGSAALQFTELNHYGKISEEGGTWADYVANAKDRGVKPMTKEGAYAAGMTLSIPQPLGSIPPGWVCQPTGDVAI